MLRALVFHTEKDNYNDSVLIKFTQQLVLLISFWVTNTALCHFSALCSLKHGQNKAQASPPSIMLKQIPTHSVSLVVKLFLLKIQHLNPENFVSLMVSAVAIMLSGHFYRLGGLKQEGTAFLYGQIKEKLLLFHLL